MTTGGSPDGGRGRRRAPRGTRRRALLSAALSTAALQVPLALGYGFLLHYSWLQMLDDGIVPAVEFYAPFPLHWPRMFALALFSIDVGVWVALVALLPLSGPSGSVFEQTRRRLRRRWLIAHAPLVPLVAILIGSHLHARALISTGAGALFFDMRQVATGTRLAGAWSGTETLLLASLSAIFFVHVSLLAGITRPWPWLRNTALAVAGAWALALVSTAALLPLGSRGLLGATTEARRAVTEACPDLARAAIDERIAAAYSAFHRTSADSPAMRDWLPTDIPRTVVVLPPLPRLPAAGIPVSLEAATGEPPGGELQAGLERRVSRRGGPVDLPLPPACSRVRVLKIDRALLADAALDVLAAAGSGPLRLGYGPVPRDPPRAATPAPGPRLVVVSGGSPEIPPDVPRIVLPLADEPPPPEAFARRGAPRAGDPDRARDPARGEPAARAPDGAGRIVLVVEPAALWDDVLRVLAAEADAGAHTIWLVAAAHEDSASSSLR